MDGLKLGATITAIAFALLIAWIAMKVLRVAAVIVLLALLVLAIVGGAIYLSTRSITRKRQR